MIQPVWDMHTGYWLVIDDTVSVWYAIQDIDYLLMIQSVCDMHTGYWLFIDDTVSVWYAIQDIDYVLIIQSVCDMPNRILISYWWYGQCEICTQDID